MQACYLSPEGSWDIRELDIPKLSDDDVLIEVKAVGICGSDLGILSGKYPITGHTVMGHEFAGIIAAVGKNVTDWKVGERVVQENTAEVCGKCYLCASGRFLECEHRQMIGGEKYAGAFAEYVRIPGRILRIYPSCMFRIPDNIPFEEAAIVDPLANGYKSVVQDSTLKPGEAIAVFGTGAIGLSCIMMAKLLNASKIIAVDLKKAEVRLAKAKELGATHIVEADSVSDVVEAVKTIAGTEGIAVAADCVAGDARVMCHCIRIVRNGGHVLSIGMSREPYNYSLVEVGLRNIRIIGHMGYDNMSWRNVLALMENGIIDAGELISHRMPLSDFGKGLELVNKGKAVKVVLYPGK